MFHRNDFHHKARRIAGYHLTIEEAEKALEITVSILNSLTRDQVSAVKLYGKSRYEDGFDDGLSD